MSGFDILDEIANVETIAIGKRIREPPRLEKQYGAGRWRKMKGEARIRLRSGRVVKLNFIGMKPMASDGKNLRENAMSNR